MERLVIDCRTGQQTRVELAPSEIAQRALDEAVESSRVQELAERRALERQRDEDLEAMLAEWRAR